MFSLWALLCGVAAFQTPLRPQEFLFCFADSLVGKHTGRDREHSKNNNIKQDMIIIYRLGQIKEIVVFPVPQPTRSFRGRL